MEEVMEALRLERDALARELEAARETIESVRKRAEKAEEDAAEATQAREEEHERAADTVERLERQLLRGAVLCPTCQGHGTMGTGNPDPHGEGEEIGPCLDCDGGLIHGAGALLLAAEHQRDEALQRASHAEAAVSREVERWRQAMEMVAEAQRERDDAREALRRYTGPAVGNEPVCERDALLAQFEEERAAHVNDVACGERRLMKVERERDEARACLAVTRGIVEAMRSDATRPKGGQTVSPRRMPVPISIIKELEQALGPDQGSYTVQAMYDLTARAEAAERREAEMRKALEVILAALPDGEGGTYWSAREWLDKRDIYNGDLDGLRVISAVARRALSPEPPAAAPNPYGVRFAETGHRESACPHGFGARENCPACAPAAGPAATPETGTGGER